MEFTRSLRNSGNNSTFDKCKGWKNWKKGDWIEATYLVRGMNKSPFHNSPEGQPCYDMKILKTNIEDFSVGEVIRLFHTHSLSNQMELITVETQCKILYWGKEISKKGNQFHDIEVLIAETNPTSSDVL